MFDKKTAVQKHQIKSDNAFKVFRATVESLSGTNDNIDGDIAIEEQKIADAKANKVAMLKIKQKNSQLVTKINDFFGLDN